MKTLTLRIPDELQERLESLARETGRTKTFYVKTAIEEFLEDREDYLLGIAALDRNEPTISLDGLVRKLGVAR